VGVRNKVKFWEDNLAGDTPLYLMFPKLYSISNCKEMVIGEVGE